MPSLPRFTPRCIATSDNGQMREQRVQLDPEGIGAYRLGFKPKGIGHTRIQTPTGRRQSAIAIRRRPVGTRISAHDAPQVETCGYMRVSRWDRLQCGALAAAN